MILLDQSFEVDAAAATTLRAALSQAAARLPPANPAADLTEAAVYVVESLCSPATTRRLQARLTLAADRLTLELECDAAPDAPPQDALDAPIAVLRRLFDDLIYRPGPPHYLRLRRPFTPRRPRLLLLEGETTLRRLYESMLQPHYDVMSCVDLTEADLSARLARPDLVLSDLGPADTVLLAGLSRLARRGATPPLTAIPIILFSSAGAAEIDAATARLGAVDHLNKPVARAQLLASVARALDLPPIAERPVGLHLVRAADAATPRRLSGFHYHLIERRGGEAGELATRLGPPGREMLLLGDVLESDAGAGLTAHFIAGALHGFAQATATPLDGPALLARLSALLAQEPGPRRRLATASLVEPLGPGRLRLTSAGQRPPLIMAEPPRPVTAPCGPALGLISDPDYVSVTVELAPGERLLVFSGAAPVADHNGQERALLERGASSDPWSVWVIEAD